MGFLHAPCLVLELQSELCWCTNWLWVKSWNDLHSFEMLPISQWPLGWDLPSSVLCNGAGWCSFVWQECKEPHLVQCKERAGGKPILSQDELNLYSHGVPASFFPSKIICSMARPARHMAVAGPYKWVEKLRLLHWNLSATSEFGDRFTFWGKRKTV